ncbi:MAG: glycosyltransferase [Desulfobacterales bacterium]|nr:glycosyltransferase [Desulfobacterales bacterium]
MKTEQKTCLFLTSVLSFTLAVSGVILTTIIFTKATALLSWLWILGFTFLFFNVSYLFHLSVAYFFIKPHTLHEMFVKKIPKVAIVYPVRNEDHGLYERIDYSLGNNLLPQLDLLILSDSDQGYESKEMDLVMRLKEKYGERVHYRRRPLPVERKQGNIKEFLTVHPEYQYIYVADADGMVPRKAVLRLLRKAEHPDNQDIAVFQCSIRIAHATSWYARFERIGTCLTQRFNFTVLQAIFRRSISFGHHQLVRTEPFSKVELPLGLLSHDNWDTVLLDQMGYRVVFCHDVCAFDEAPSNYLESRARTGRWIQGTLQGWPLVFKKGISPASRFLAFYGIYLYFADIIFFLWAILGVMAHSAPMGELIHFEIDSIWLGLFTNSILKWVLLFSLGVILFHKLVIVRSWKDLREYLYELFFSTLVILNNFIYVPLAIVALPFKRLHWLPMKKNPFEGMSFSRSLKSLWPGTCFGIIGFYFCTQETPYFVWQASPILTSLILSIPLVYLTAKSVPERARIWI